MGTTGETLLKKVNLAAKLAEITEHWRPQVIALVNAQEVKLVKFAGDFVWHRHDDTDELFLGLSGRFRVEFRGGAVEIEPGEFVVVPRGVEHRTVGIGEVAALVVEAAGVRNTGNVQDEKLTAPTGE